MTRPHADDPFTRLERLAALGARKVLSNDRAAKTVSVEETRAMAWACAALSPNSTFSDAEVRDLAFAICAEFDAAAALVKPKGRPAVVTGAL